MRQQSSPGNGYVIKEWEKRVALSIITYLGNRTARLWRRQLDYRGKLVDPSWRYSIRKILVLELGTIGDTILALPALEQLRRLFPDAEITILVRPVCVELLAHSPFVDRVLPYQDLSFGGTAAQRAVSSATMNTVRGITWDAAIDLRADLRSIWLLWRLGIPVRLSQDIRSGGFLLTHRASYTGVVHEADRKVAIVSALSSEPLLARASRLKLDPRVEDSIAARAAALRAAYPGRRLIAIQLGASKPEKQWPLTCFSELITRIRSRPDLLPVLIGSQSDVAARDQLQVQNQSGPMEDLVGLTSVSQAAAWAGAVDLVVSCDSMLGHAAAAAQVPVVVLFDWLNEGRYLPWNSSHRALYKEHPARTGYRSAFRSINLISVEDVLTAVDALLAPGPAVEQDPDRTAQY